MPYSALQVANKIIELGRKATPPQYYTPMQLLKLVYIAHGWNLAVNGTPLIREAVKAWKYGPVIPELYQDIKKYRANPIFDETIGHFWDNKTASFTDAEINVIDFVVLKYGVLDGFTLSRITHAQNTPWSIVFNHEWGGVIDMDLIAKHYRNLMNKALSNDYSTTA